MSDLRVQITGGPYRGYAGVARGSYDCGRRIEVEIDGRPGVHVYPLIEDTIPLPRDEGDVDEGDVDDLAALKIGTRVRIDDRSLAWHDDVGTIVRVPGPGDAPDVYDVKLDGGTLTAHRAQLALVDDTLPECDACHGSGQVALFSSLAECHACGGSGVRS